MSIKNLIRYSAFTLIFLIALTILFLMPLYVYNTSVKFLDIIDQNIKNTLFITVYSLTAIFIISIIINRFYQNVITKYTYLPGAIWMGILINLFFLFTVYWIIFGLLNLFNITAYSKLIFIIILIISFALSVYGLINTGYIRKRYIDIPIKDLPDFWNNKKAVLFTDVHLGNILGQKYLNRLVKNVNSLSPDLIFIAGDLFDGNGEDVLSFTGHLNNLKSREGIFFALGNHESFMNVNKLNALISKLDFNTLINDVVNINGLQIAGVNFYSEMNDKNPQILVDKRQKNTPLILLNHEPSKILFAKELGTDLQLSGHTHKGQLFPINYITRLIYGKYYYGLTREDGFQIYTSNGVGTWGPPMRTFNSPEIVIINLIKD